MLSVNLLTEAVTDNLDALLKDVDYVADSAANNPFTMIG